MKVTTMAPGVVQAEKATHIDNIVDGLVALGAQLAMSSDGVRDGIALRQVFKRDTMEAQEYCLASGVLVGKGWLSMVVQGRLKGFARNYSKAPAVPLPKNLLLFPRWKCEKEPCKSCSGDGSTTQETLRSCRLGMPHGGVRGRPSL
jgi:hypothetical protein